MMQRIAVSSDNFFLDGSNVATPKNDAWHLYILSDLTKEERECLQGASAEDASKVISAYMQCISNRREKSGAAAFMEWYKGFESRSAVWHDKGGQCEPTAGVAATLGV